MSAKGATWIFYLGFVLAGVGCAMPGALLPALLADWRLSDRGAGVLFLVLALGSAIGSLARVGRLWQSLCTGFTLLTLAGTTWNASLALIYPDGFAWGLGLGMTMTSITLFQQRRDREKTVGLVRLNLLWALGACACPPLMSHALKTNSPRSCFFFFGMVAAAFGACVLILRPVYHGFQGAPAAEGLTLRGVPLALIAATALATGVEASAGAWLATYAERSTRELAYVIAAPTCLWAGLLGSRILGSFARSETALHAALKPILALVLLSSLGLVMPFRFALLGGAFLLGAGLGPIYPTLLARVMKRSQTRSIFFACGITSALMPLLTGVISTHFASLRSGLSILIVGTAALLFLGWRLPEQVAVDLNPGERLL